MSCCDVKCANYGHCYNCGNELEEGEIMWKPCQFDRESYLEHKYEFENIEMDDFTYEMTEFNDDPEELAAELAYMRYRVAKLEKAICTYLREKIKTDFSSDEQAIFSFESWANFGT